MSIVDTAKQLFLPRKSSKNTLFRPREVRIEWQTRSATGVWSNPAGDKTSTTLAEVTNINEKAVGEVGIMKGSISAVIQPWYLSPIAVEITGKSYMGSFADTALNSIAVDDDIEVLMRIRKNVNNSFVQIGAVTPDDFRVKLIYGSTQSGDSVSNYGVAQTLYGFLGEISSKEGEDKAFFKEYSFRFVGELSEEVSVANGSTRQVADKNVAKTILFGL